VVDKGPTGVVLDSTYGKRSDPLYLTELGNTLVNFARIVPDGLLVFFPSYSALKESMDHWRIRHDSRSPSILERLEKMKPVKQISYRIDRSDHHIVCLFFSLIVDSPSLNLGLHVGHSLLSAVLPSFDASADG
jgi:hypothetical protein